MKSFRWKLKKKANPNDIGSGEVFVCLMVLVLCLVFSFVMEYGLLIEKAEIFKEEVRVILEDALKEGAANSLYELRREQSIKRSEEEIAERLSKYRIEKVVVQKIELNGGSGLSISGLLLLDFHFGGQIKFTAKIPFYEQKIYQKIELEE